MDLCKCMSSVALISIPPFRIRSVSLSTDLSSAKWWNIWETRRLLTVYICQPFPKWGNRGCVTISSAARNAVIVNKRNFNYETDFKFSTLQWWQSVCSSRVSALYSTVIVHFNIQTFLFDVTCPLSSSSRAYISWLGHTIRLITTNIGINNNRLSATI